MKRWYVPIKWQKIKAQREGAELVLFPPPLSLSCDCQVHFTTHYDYLLRCVGGGQKLKSHPASIHQVMGSHACIKRTSCNFHMPRPLSKPCYYLVNNEAADCMFNISFALKKKLGSSPTHLQSCITIPATHHQIWNEKLQKLTIHKC